MKQRNITGYVMSLLGVTFLFVIVAIPETIVHLRDLISRNNININIRIITLKDLLFPRRLTVAFKFSGEIRS